jgi:hypothetical protein
MEYCQNVRCANRAPCRAHPTRICEPKITVECKSPFHWETSRIATGAWEMHIECRIGKSGSFSYRDWEPYRYTAEEWLALANGERNLRCCGSGFAILNDGNIEFGAAGKMHHLAPIECIQMVARFPLSALAGPLRAAIESAIARGLRFKQPEK